jgi:hypothetical protein
MNEWISLTRNDVLLSSSPRINPPLPVLPLSFPILCSASAKPLARGLDVHFAVNSSLFSPGHIMFESTWNWFDIQLCSPSFSVRCSRLKCFGVTAERYNRILQYAVYFDSQDPFLGMPGGDQWILHGQMNDTFELK